MAEEIDLNVNNLSATEEAFEVFQTNAMYTEDECITLPVKDCPQPAAEDAAGELSDMSIENDLVSSTNIEDQSYQLSYCNLDVGSEVNVTEEEPNFENEANFDPGYSHEMDSLPELSSEFAKYEEDGGNMEVGQVVELETVSSTEVNNPTDLSPSKRGRGRYNSKGRRGRAKGRGRGKGWTRPRRGTKKPLCDTNSIATNSENDLVSESPNLSSQSFSDNGLGPSNNNIDTIPTPSNGFITSPTQSMDTSLEEIPVVKRRGRKKKVVSDAEITSPDNDTSPKAPRKRGRPRKDSALNIILENPVPINEEALASTTTCSEMKDPSEMVENLKDIEENLSKLEENRSNIKKIDEDDDDVCLSKLKTTIDCDNSVTEVNDPILMELQEIPSSPTAEDLKNEDSDSAVVPSQGISQVEEIKESDSKVEVTENTTVEEVVGNTTVEEVVENTSVMEEVENTSFDPKESLLVEDVSKRPKRRNTKKTLQYRNDDDSDEDPFANVELSDDDEPRRKKGGRYQSDDEYIPGRKGRTSSIDSSDSAAGDALEELQIQTKKRSRKKKDIGFEMAKASPSKASIMDVDAQNEPWGYSPNATVEELCDVNNVAIPQPSLSDDTKPIKLANPWLSSNEFENFLAKKTQGTNLKIKKVSSSKSTPSVVAPLEIPVIDQNKVKKTVDSCAQTKKVQTATASSQTSGPETLSMKTNVPLNDKQSENACNFLKSIVKTTSELGLLMTQKSEDFIQKKINTANVVDTFKMDYCVKKSFLLLKLAKHNITQMEEDLSNQYEKFLNENELMSYREQEKKIQPKPKKADSDSDCEIIEEPMSTPKPVAIKKETKPKFNPKTVFLNKELSIKIAKKPTEEVKSNKNINIKGRHTVWINDSVMVKKVKGSQSFLAQDSRNKKPPDNIITEKMVSDFFADYNRQKAIFVCAPFVSTEWFVWRPKAYVCKYFSVEPDKLTSGNISRTDEIFTDNENDATVSDSANGISEKTQSEVSKLKNPTTLLSICLKILKEHFYMVDSSDVNMSPLPECASKTSTYEPKTLFSSCFNHLTKNQQNVKQPNTEINASEVHSQIIPSLKMLCHSRITELYFVNKTVVKNIEKMESVADKSVNETISEEILGESSDSEHSNSDIQQESGVENEVKSLYNVYTPLIPDSQNVCEQEGSVGNIVMFNQNNQLNEDSQKVCEPHIIGSKVKSLFNLCIQLIQDSQNVCEQESSVGNEVKSLFNLCIQLIKDSQMVCEPERSVGNEVESISNLNTQLSLDFQRICESNISDLPNLLSDSCIEVNKEHFVFSQPKSLKKVSFESVKKILNVCKLKPDIIMTSNVAVCNKVPNKVMKLADICFNIVSRFYDADYDSHDVESSETTNIELTVNAVNNDDSHDVESSETTNIELTVNAVNNDDSHDVESSETTNIESTVNAVNNDDSHDVESSETTNIESTVNAVNNDDSHDVERSDTTNIELTINAVNTLSEEAFLNIEETSANDQDNSDYYEEEGGTFYEDESMEPEYNQNEVTDNRENQSWISQLELKEMKSCFVSDKSKQISKSIPDSENDNIVTENYPLIANIKTEPGLEEPPPTNQQGCDPFATNIKIEPDHFVDQMTIIPESIVTKSECLDNVDPSPVGREPIVRQNSASFDEENFEAFVRSNKMINGVSNYDNENEETFSQSALRVRRQHEPDSDNENDTSMSLLVPQTFEPLTVESAKGSLLENSSSDGENYSKKNCKRKPISKRKTKKSEPPKQSKEIPSKEIKDTPSKENKEVLSKENKEVISKQNKHLLTKGNKEMLSKDKPLNEVAVLTRRMRERIRLEEKKAESSESESENLAPAIIQEKESKRETRRSRLAAKNNKPIESEIQCNNVDSTQQLIDSSCNKSKLDCGPNTKEDNNFTGFSVVDQNEISTYHKYVKYVYDQIIPKVNEETAVKNIEITTRDTQENPDGKISSDKKNETRVLPENEMSSEKNEETENVIHPDEPIELLECTPTMPIFDDDNVVKPKRKSTKAETKSPAKKMDAKDRQQDNIEPEEKLEAKEEEAIANKAEEELVANKVYTERNGWKCYSIQPTDTKLYEQVTIPLEKLPESFVQTYFEYQEIAVKSKDDAEIDRLTNLQSLVRHSSVKKARTRKDKVTTDENGKSIQDDSDRTETPPDTDNYNELSPSEDEGGYYDDDYSAPVPDAENNMAKNSLMNDEEEDDLPLSARRIKKDLDGDANTRRKRTGPKSKTVDIKQEHPESLMLTADKMMNKELTLLHAPVVLDNDSVNTPTKGPVTRNKPRSGTKYYGRGDRIKSDDSSSEEEKQWVNTKEKLLKRLGKRQETAIEDDAKRAKLVTEFIERRNDKPLVVNHKARGRGSRRSRKKMLERQKQMRVLSYELLGETGPHIGKSNSAAYFKGRRNIRKVIDKKSLARSTVIANMEEFERKRRLNMKQKRLEELLGCEEGVNVIVTNDEVCLEYDFQESQPAVTVHPFFTKVMKAHQYEGVKFMWDACFESIEKVQSGHPGGGCILAHCMGLGKTLQVLALLHTVLTHPKVGMHRVLVCCPLSTVLNWVDEIHKWIGPVTDEIKVFELSKLKKTYERAYQLEDWYSGGGIFIIGYELFRSLTTLDAELDDVRQTIIDKIRTALLDPGPDIIVCDEGHLLKNDCSVLAVAMSRVATRRRIVLTGTPMQNNLREYYCMVNFVKPNLLGTYSEYSNRFENPIMNGQHRDSQVDDIKLMKARTHILHKVLEGCLQRQEASVLYPYLPKKHEYTVFISLTKCQCDLYKHYLNACANKNKQSILRDFHTLQKIWSHPLVLHKFNLKSHDEKNKLKTEKLEDDLAREDLTASEDIKPAKMEEWWLQYLEGGDMLERLESSNKFMAVFRILKECVALDDRVLIFSTSLITMDALEYFLKKINNWSLGQEYYRLDGSVPPEVRQKWCREFNAEHNYKTKLFLISTRAGSLGLNMTAANRVIILDTSWNPAHDIQSIFRVYRFGQKKDCYIYRLVALGTMEQKIYERAVTKQAVSCRVVDEQQIDRHYNMAELTELYRFDETGSGVAGGVAVGVHDLVLLRVARDSALHAVHEHDSLLRGSEPALPEHERAAAWDQFQQEQHNQMQTDNVPKKEKKISKRSLSLEKPATSTMPEIKTEPEGSLEAPMEPKSKRGRKIITCRIPIQASPHSLPQPSTSSQPDFYVDKNEEIDMVSKISQILVSHEFNNKRHARDLSKLITTVQQVVASGDLSRLPPGDEAAAKIAQILLRKGPTATVVAMPALTDIRNPVLEQSKNKYDQTENHILTESQEETITGDLNVKTRRRAAVSAQKKFDDIADDIVIDLNDDDWQNNDDYAFAPTRNPEPVPEEKREPKNPPVAKYKPGPKSKKKPVKTSEPNRKPPEAPATQQLVDSIQKSIDGESILLSDDEIVPEVRAPVAIKQEPEATKDNVQKYPLHPSLLTNQNFIKIVAHTYLAGNPMLDEDAALLAARYSTSKALREIDATGKSIESGPIYDIAVKVLGMDILKKLHTSGPTESTATKSQQKALSDTERMLSDAAPEPEQKPPARLKAKVTSDLMPTERKPKIANLGLVKLTPVTPVITAPVVVPVGLIKRAGPVEEDSECILPDDDDVRVVSSPSPSPAPSPSPSLAPSPSPAPAPPPRRARAPLLLNSVLAGPAYDRLLTNIKVPIAPAVSQSDNQPTIKVVGNRMIAVGPDPPASTATVTLVPAAPAPAPAPGRGRPAPAPRPSAPAPGSATICLDSDDDEPPPPVPVTLTAATSGVRLELQMPEETPLRAQPDPKPRGVKPAPAADPGKSTPPSRPTLLRRVRAPAPPAPAPKPEIPKPQATTVCRPGDIIRITKSGQVEVLNKVDVVPEHVARAPRPGPGPACRKPAAPPPPPAESVAEPPERPVRIASDGSSGSRSPSPVDPLSILRNVVQISADRYEHVALTDPPPTPPEPAPKKPDVKPAPKKPDVKPAPKKPDAKPSSLFDKLKTLKQNQLAKPVESTKAVGAAQSRFKKQTSNKGASVVVDSVDLTEVPFWPAPQTKPDKAKTATFTTITPGKTGKRVEPVATVVGTSKNIILTGLGKNNKVTVGSAPASSSKGSVRVTNMETLSPATFKRTDKKRPAVKIEPEAPKRKKTEPMTLKDFNLDDIDDIIELE